VSNAIWFWMAKPLAELLMAVILIGGIGTLMVAGVSLQHLTNKANAWIDKKRRSN